MRGCRLREERKEAMEGLNLQENIIKVAEGIVQFQLKLGLTFWQRASHNSRFFVMELFLSLSKGLMTLKKIALIRLFQHPASRRQAPGN